MGAKGVRYEAWVSKKGPNFFTFQGTIVICSGRKLKLSG